MSGGRIAPEALIRALAHILVQTWPVHKLLLRVLPRVLRPGLLVFVSPSSREVVFDRSARTQPVSFENP